MSGGGEIKVYGLFEGVGGFRLGLERANGQGGERLPVERRGGKGLRGVGRGQDGDGGGRGPGPRFRWAGSCEVDRWAVGVYNWNFRSGEPRRDARRLDPARLPDVGLLCAGFPCQPFSAAGKRRGFEDTRGTLFHEICRVAEARRPPLLLLENVLGLLWHDEGRTFGTILAALDGLGYDAEWQVLNSKHFGVPQNRQRVFVVGHLRGEPWKAVFPLGEGAPLPEGEGGRGRPGDAGGEASALEAGYGFSTRAHGETYLILTGQPTSSAHAVPQRRADSRTLGTRMDQAVSVGELSGHQGDGVYDPRGQAPTLAASFQQSEPKVFDPYSRNRVGRPGTLITRSERNSWIVGGEIRRLTPTECERLQGFPDGWTAMAMLGGRARRVPDSQRYRMMGNAVTVNVVEEVGRKLLSTLK